jgi:hypothetical protein
MATGEVVQRAPHSARLTFLAAQFQLARDQASADPFPGQVCETLLEAFNDLPEVRKWLATFREATGAPGLWQQVCRPMQDPKAKYRERRQEFIARYESGLLHRSDKAAYIHRQDHFMSRQPSFRQLHEHLMPDGLVGLTVDEKKEIEAWLVKKPEWVTGEWLKSTERVSGKIKLHGNQRAELIRRAAAYLDYADRAWRAAQALASAPATLKEVERLQKQLRDLLPAAQVRSQGQPWGPLFRQLAGRLPS